jgi:uncharacterized protein YigA (DUF484 family)
MSSGVQGITEADIANYLVHTPGFFERHAEVLAAVQLASPHGQRAVSLQERQMQMLRERIKGLEHKIVEMIRHGQENVAIAERLHRWTRALLLSADPAALPEIIVRDLQHEFMVPQAALRVWHVAEPYAGLPFTLGVSDDIRSFTASLGLPYCGLNSGFEAAQWLDAPASVTSIALVPLRHGAVEAGRGTIGLLVLGSPDPTRYSAEMGTEFLLRVGELASAALSRLVRV